MGNSLRRKGKNELIKVIRTHEDAIKRKCYDCVGGQKRYVCHITDCPLHPYSPLAPKNINSGEKNQIRPENENNEELQLCQKD